MINFQFNQEKATQVAAAFINMAGGQLNYMKLIKLMYLADRQALRERCSPITGDSFVAMKFGPVVSEVYDLIKGETYHSESWDSVVERVGTYDVHLKQEPGEGLLSRRERRIMTEVFEQFRNVDQFGMADWCHENCGEWERRFETIKETNQRAIPIPVEDIFAEVGVQLSAEDLRIIEAEAAHDRSLIVA